MREMKDSGVEWIGNIPNCWKLERLSWHLNEINEKNDPIKTTNILSLTNKEGVLPYEDRGNQGNKAKENYDEYKIAYPDTIVANSMNILIGSVGLCNYYGCVSPVYYVLKTNENSDLRFMNYIMQTTEFQKELRRYANGIMEIRLRVSAEDIFKRPVPIPSRDEQIHIADFLDKKVSEIDAVISKTKESIEEYKKLKQSIITEAVTKGLDLNVEMKDSGIEWIGSIPANWYVCKFKYCQSSPMLYGANEAGIEYDESLPRYIRITDITMDNKLKDTGKLSLTDEMADGYLLKNKDLLFARSGGTVGKSFLYREEYGKSAFAGYLIKATVDKLIIPEFAYYYTLSDAYSSWKDRVFIQSTIQNIGADKYSNMELPIPPKREQEQIVVYIDGQCFKYDALISKKEQVITELEQYKKSLIYEYVTGKREVA